MARPLTLICLLLLFVVRTPGLHAVESPTSKLAQRYKNNCDAGQGLGCYAYGRVLWNQKRQKEAVHYFARGCDLKYKLACESYHDHSTTTRTWHKRTKETSARICFSSQEMTTATLTPNPISKSGVQGMKIVGIKVGSFWMKAGILDNDIIVKMNNQAFNSSSEVLKAFNSSGKTFGFEIVRDDETVTLWYTCQ